MHLQIRWRFLYADTDPPQPEAEAEAAPVAAEQAGRGQLARPGGAPAAARRRQHSSSSRTAAAAAPTATETARAAGATRSNETGQVSTSCRGVVQSAQSTLRERASNARLMRVTNGGTCTAS